MLHTVPGNILLQLGRQGMLALAAKSVKRGESSLAALLQSCVSAFGLQSLGCVDWWVLRRMEQKKSTKYNETQ